MTFIELVQSIVPDCTDAEADYILWEYTVFPFDCREETLIPQIQLYLGERIQRSTHLGAL